MDGEGAAPVLIVLSATDPVASALAERWGTLPSTGAFVEGAAVRRLDPHRSVLQRPGPHIRDERLDLRLPVAVRSERPTLVFASVHRSESEQPCFAVHPLGNPGGQAELGGVPRTLVPTDPARMVALLRRLDELAAPLGMRATYEATHHGPELALPALFAEVAVREGAQPTSEEVAALASALTSAEPDGRDRVALGVGGGHYAPRFADLARSRRWSFGHLISRHALGDLAPATARAALDGTPGAAGVLFARAQDRAHPAVASLGPELRERDAERREEGRLTASSLPASGT